MQQINNYIEKYSEVLLHIILILLLAWIAKRLSERAIRMLKAYLGGQAEDNPEELKRIETLGQVFHYVTSVVIVVVAGMLLLGELGISIGPLLATAGVVGMAIGFGAQHLIRDYFNGFFMLLENQVRQGDVVTVADKGGLVEEVTLRYIKLRDYDGNVHFIPNGTITTVTNMSRGYAFAVIDVGVAYRENIDEVITIMKRVGEDLAEDTIFSGKILEPIEMAGVDKWDESAVVIRCRFKVPPLEQWGVRREYLKRLKQAFDEHGIEIPYPHITVYPGQGKDGSAPPLNLVASTKPLGSISSNQ
jgi:small-conductance mechanosensitive channel